MLAEKNLSQMIVDVAGQFIELETSQVGRDAHLQIACKAWNISILPKSKQKKEYYKFLEEMRSIIKDKETMKWFRIDLDGLIKAKLDLYPEHKMPIVSASLENVDKGQYRVRVTFARPGQLDT